MRWLICYKIRATRRWVVGGLFGLHGSSQICATCTHVLSRPRPWLPAWLLSIHHRSPPPLPARSSCLRQPTVTRAVHQRPACPVPPASVMHPPGTLAIRPQPVRMCHLRVVAYDITVLDFRRTRCRGPVARVAEPARSGIARGCSRALPPLYVARACHPLHALVCTHTSPCLPLACRTLIKAIVWRFACAWRPCRKGAAKDTCLINYAEAIFSRALVKFPESQTLLVAFADFTMVSRHTIAAPSCVVMCCNA